MIKKRFIILIIAFAVALASFAGVFAFGLEQFKVEHQMETIFGNPSDANGLTISYALKSGKNANWEMEYKLENGSFTPKTHFWSTSLKHNIENFNLNHYKISYDDAENSYMGAYRGYDTDAIEQMYRDKFNEQIDILNEYNIDYTNKDIYHEVLKISSQLQKQQHSPSA